MLQASACTPTQIFAEQVCHSCVCRYEGSAADLCLDFTVEDDTFGSKTLQELRPGGEDMAVTDDNKLQYIHLVADWHLKGRRGACSAAFARGLHAVSAFGGRGLLWL